MTVHHQVVSDSARPYCFVEPEAMERAMGEHGLRRCSIAELPDAIRIGEQLIHARLASHEVVLTLDSITSMTAWVVGKPIEGIYLILPLTEEGRDAVEAGTFNAADPALRHVAPANTPIFGLYVGIYAGATRDARRSIMAASANVRVSLYAPVPCYARGATEDGARSMLQLGFRQFSDRLPDLFVFDPLI